MPRFTSGHRTAPATITTLWMLLAAPDGFFDEVRGALGLNPIFQFFGYRRPGHGIGDQRQRCRRCPCSTP